MTIRELNVEFEKHRERWPQAFWSVGVDYSNYGSSTKAGYTINFWSSVEAEVMSCVGASSLAVAFEIVQTKVMKLVDVCRVEEMDASLVI